MTFVDIILYTIVVAFLVLIVLPIYFLPTLLAGLRGHKKKIPLFFANLGLGWTVIGWAGVLLWALAEPPKAR